MGLLINLKEDFMKKLMLAFVLLLGVVVSVKAQSIYGCLLYTSDAADEL